MAAEANDEPALGVVRAADGGTAAPATGAALAGAGVVTPASAAELPTLGDVYREHAPYVWRALRRLGVAAADVEDACHEVFLIVHRKLPTFAGRSSLRTWLYGIVVRHASDRRRSARRDPAPPIATSEQSAELAIDAGQADALARREACALLDAILDELDDARRAVFVLYELEELTMAEVAAAVGCPLQTAYSRLQSARAAVDAAARRVRAREGAP